MFLKVTFRFELRHVIVKVQFVLFDCVHVLMRVLKNASNLRIKLSPRKKQILNKIRNWIDLWNSFLWFCLFLARWHSNSSSLCYPNWVILTHVVCFLWSVFRLFPPWIVRELRSNFCSENFSISNYYLLFRVLQELLLQVFELFINCFLIRFVDN